MQLLPDKETNKILTDQEKIKMLINHEGWPIVRAMFDEKILRLQNVNSVVGTTATAKEKSMEVNKKVSEVLFEILQEISGTAEQFDTNGMQPIRDKPYVVRT